MYVLKKILNFFSLRKAQCLHIWEWELWLQAILLNAWLYNHELDFLYNLLCHLVKHMVFIIMNLIFFNNLLCFVYDLHWLLKILQRLVDDLNICMFEMTILESCVIIFVCVFLNFLTSELLFKFDEYLNQVNMLLSYWRKCIC